MLVSRNVGISIFFVSVVIGLERNVFKLLIGSTKSVWTLETWKYCPTNQTNAQYLWLGNAHFTP